MWWRCICCSQRASEAEKLVCKEAFPGPQFQSRIVYLTCVWLLLVSVNGGSFLCEERAWNQKHLNLQKLWLLLLSCSSWPNCKCFHLCRIVPPSYRCATCRHWGTSGNDSIGICCGTSCGCDSEDHSDRTPALTWLCVWRNPTKKEKERQLLQILSRKTYRFFSFQLYTANSACFQRTGKRFVPH